MCAVGLERLTKTLIWTSSDISEAQTNSNVTGILPYRHRQAQTCTRLCISRKCETPACLGSPVNTQVGCPCGRLRTQSRSLLPGFRELNVSGLLLTKTVLDGLPTFFGCVARLQPEITPGDVAALRVVGEKVCKDRHLIYARLSQDALANENEYLSDFRAVFEAVSLRSKHGRRYRIIPAVRV